MFVYKKKINFFDCDPAGILFYGRVYELCHSAYEAMIESFNLREDYWTNENYAVPIISSEAKYLKPIKNGDEIMVEIKVLRLKTSSFELLYDCKNKKGESCASVKTVHVFIDKKNWTKTGMSNELSSRFSDHLNEK
ncbi:MAG TPA: acyl-CoA thioesterase [Ignavibacteriaceae bacterium]|nr:acyl-CoA thioesterase [Ignavibacteriaceae bacterium]